MTLIEILSKVPFFGRVTVTKRASAEVLIEAQSAEDIMGSRRFHEGLAGLEVCGLGLGDLFELAITVE